MTDPEDPIDAQTVAFFASTSAAEREPYIAQRHGSVNQGEVLPGLGEPRYEPIPALQFHTRITSKYYGDDYAVE